MAIKDLFRNEEATSVLTGKTVQEVASEAESENYIDAYTERKNRSIPQVDLFKPENFAKYGSAEKYYRDSIDRITKTYPYDGSGYEKILWELSSSYHDLHLFENEYPRTNGYVHLGIGGWGTNVITVEEYGATATSSYEFIHVSQSINKQNVSNLAKGQGYNLELNTVSGSTVEFWLKKTAYAGPSKTKKEVIFDLWNGALSSSAHYGRFRVEISASATAGDSPFRVTYMSGTLGFNDRMIGNSFDTSSLLNDWNHYAFTVISGSTDLELKFYLNGELNDTETVSHDLGKIISSGSEVVVGSLLTSPSGNVYHSLGSDMKGWAKLSASLDEFRFWKTKRTSRDIGRNWFSQIDGGTNTDTSNTDLGLYFKFNEGITGISSIDSQVLDYSGRVSNATWTGYTSTSRNVGSAIVSASAAEFETKDPIIYSDHPDVKSLREDKIRIGKEYDYTNNSSIIKTVPAWIVEEDEEEGGNELKNLTQIIASYFDSLHLQIEVLPELSAIEYVSGSSITTGSFKPYPFTDRMLESRGLPSPELFADAEVLEFFKDRDEDRVYRDTVHEIKNLIYKNIHNNLIHIYKTKGTEKSFRNLFHCFGIDEELLKINLYADNETYTFEDRYQDVVEKKRYANFFNTGSFDATVFQQTSSAITDSVSYVSGSGLVLLEKDYPVTIEAECVFPKLIEAGQEGYFPVPVTCSLFGAHSAMSASAAGDMTWDPSDSGSFHVYAVRNNSTSTNARFYLSSSQHNFTALSSSVFTNVFDNKRWNFAVRVKPSKNKQAFVGTENHTGSTPSTYDIEFYGVNPILTNVSSSFYVTGTCTSTQGSRFLSDRKRVFIGAHRTNFTGAVLQQSYAKISSVRYWMSYLDNATINFHALSPLNYGTPDPYKNAYLYENLGSTALGDTYLLTGSSYPYAKTLAMHWDFSGLTGSGPSAVESFTVTDMSSGSAIPGEIGRIGNVIQKHHPGVGYGFPANHKPSILIEHIQSAKKRLPEILNSYDMVNIISGSQEDTFGRDERPISYFMSIEKSMYQNISEEMINMFSTISAFDNLIGEPVHRYRESYKNLEKLREIFFSKVSNIPDVEKFIDFYKWFDAALNKIIGELIPVSARISDKVQNVVESHILERNKYRSKFPTLEEKLNVIEGVIKGIAEQMPVDDDDSINIPRNRQAMARMSDNWSVGSAPIPKNQKDNVLWWTTRAERSPDLPSADFTSGDSTVDASRQTIAAVVQQATDRKKQLALRATFKQSCDIKSGVNFPTQKKSDFYKSKFAQFGVSANKIDIKTGLREGATKLLIDRRLNTEDYSDLIQKEKLDFQVNDGSGDMLFPFSIYSSSVTTGYGAGTSLHSLTVPEGINVDITNLHEDAYELGRPMQGPFAKTHVGGLANRSTFVNDGTDTEANRAESWRIRVGSGTTLNLAAPDINSAGSTNAHLPRVNFYRDGIARRPLNIKNIQYTTASKFLGNYQKDYQVVQTSNRRLNNRWFVDTEGGDLETSAINFKQNSFTLVSTSSSGITANLKEYKKPVRGRGKHVIVERFSAPGGPETAGDSDGGPGLDAASAEYSIYNCLNYRNFNVRQVLNDISGINCGLGGQSSHEEDTGSWYSANPSASFHKTQRNGSRRIEYLAGFDASNDPGDGSAFTTASVYNNMFLQVPIPAQDSGYAWITASAVATSLPLGHALAEDEITFLTASEIQKSSIHGTFAGINNLIYDPVVFDSNTLSSSTNVYLNTSLATPSSHEYLNLLILHRNGPYHHASWKQIRGRNHPIRRDEVKNNRFSIVKRRDKAHIGATEKFKKVTTFKQFTEPPLTSKHKYISHEFAITGYPESVRYKVDHSYGNNKERFTNRDLNVELFGTSRNNKTQMYDQLYQQYTDPDLVSQANNINFRNMIYREVVYPAAEITYLSGTRGRTQFTYDHLWNSTRANRTKANRVNEFNETIGSESVWPLDARTDFATATPADPGATNADGSGGLQSAYTVFYKPALFDLSASALYSRRTPISGTAMAANDSTAIAGDTLWEAASQSGLEPYYTSYGSYAEVMRAQGKEYSIIPEFRISDHLEYYIKDKRSDFFADRAALFSITGAATPDSSDDSFCREYLHSDFMKFFDVLRRDHEENNASAVTLTCKAYKKFLPYEGFYPVQRAIQVASLFSSSYASALTSSGADSDNAGYSDTIKYRPIASALYAPGILFNTIKSGIAVDYPVHTEKCIPTSSMSSSLAGLGHAAPGEMPPSHVSQSVISNTFDRRVPFEALLKPETFFPGKVADSEPHSKAGLNITASFNLAKQPDPLYNIAINNFLAESMNFFLKKQGPGAITSKPIEAPIEFTDDGFSRYAMEITLKQTEDFTMYDRPSAFGPPCEISYYFLNYTPPGGSQSTGYVTASVYWPFTPPYSEASGALYLDTNKSTDTLSTYGPGAKALIIFPDESLTLDKTKSYTITDIINSSSVQYRREHPLFIEGGSHSTTLTGEVDDRPTPVGPGHTNKMMISSSVNLFSIVKDKNITFSPGGGIQSISNEGASTTDYWVISPKFECPVLNFHNVSVTAPTHGSSVTSKGMWHQYGSIPNENEGIFLTVGDSADFRAHGVNAEKTGSLTKIMGFSAMGAPDTMRRIQSRTGAGASIKIGELAQSKEVWEAVVAIPFMHNIVGEKEFFTIPRNQIQYAQKVLAGASSRGDFEGIDPSVMAKPPHQTIIDIVAAQKKYVFPPTFNFVEFEEVPPTIMFVFEFNYKFTEQDLSNMWQNLLPSNDKTRGPVPLGHSNPDFNSTVSDISEASIVHPSLRSAFFDPTKKNARRELRWMVFKVKQRAVNNYSDIVRLSSMQASSYVRDITSRVSLDLPLGDMIEKASLVSDRSDDMPALSPSPEVTRGYSYNWPYDYFSFVELVNMEAEVVLSSESEEDTIDETTRVHEGIIE